MNRLRRRPFLLTAVLLPALLLSRRGGATPTPLLWHYSCAGQEPAWSLEIAETSGRLTRPSVSGDAVVELDGAMRRPAQLEPAWAVWRGHTRAGAYTLVAILREESCRAQTDAAAAPYRALVSFPDGSAASGCCQAEQRLDVRAAAPARYAGKPADDWSHNLPELLPAIGACLRSGGPGATGVSYAAVADGQVSVRLVGSDGTRSECRVAASGPATPAVAPLAAEAGQPPGDELPLYWPVRGQPPQRRCGRLEQVLGARNVLVGYLYYPEGCEAAPH